MSDTKEKMLIDPVDEIAIDQLAPSDTLLVETENSLYCFTVSNPLMQCGVLVGGIVAKEPTRVTLIASPATDRRSPDDRTMLCMGNRAVVLIETADGLRRGVTSVITGLFRVNGAGAVC